MLSPAGRHARPTNDCEAQGAGDQACEGGKSGKRALMSKCAVDECAVAKSSQLSVALSETAPTCHDHRSVRHTGATLTTCRPTCRRARSAMRVRHCGQGRVTKCSICEPCLVDNTEVLDVDVHARVLVELPLRAHEREPRGHRAAGPSPVSEREARGRGEGAARARRGRGEGVARAWRGRGEGVSARTHPTSRPVSAHDTPQ